jgi:hypothetical protein
MAQNNTIETSAKYNYKVPRILWENLEAVLLTQSKKYIEELAKILGVPAKELQKRVMPSANSVKVILQDTQESTCRAYVQNGAFTVFCRKPVFNGDFCAAHCGVRPIVNDTNAAPIKKVKDMDMLPPMWEKDTSIPAISDLYVASGQRIGKVNHDKQKITIYTIDT